MYNTILKFGGSCFSSLKRTSETVNIIKYHYDRGDNPDVVVSAIGASPDPSRKMTDYLLHVSSLIKKGDYGIALESVRKAEAMYAERGSIFGVEKQVFDHAFSDLEFLCSEEGFASFERGFKRPNQGKTGELLALALDDYVAGFGELGSIVLLEAALNSRAIKAKAVDSAKAGFISNSDFKSAELSDISIRELIGKEYKRIKNRTAGAVLVYSGFNASDAQGNRTTLGRDGSNVTALALGAALHSNSVIIYSDDPILPIDPRIVENDQPVRHLSYGEFAALANGGVKAIPVSMIDILRKSQNLPPIYMRSALNHEDIGTMITSYAKNAGVAKAMAVRGNVSFREFPVNDDAQAEKLKSIIFGFNGVSVLRCVDEIDLGGRRVTFTYQVDPKFVDRLRADLELRKKISDKVVDADEEFAGDPGRYFKQTMFKCLKQIYDGEKFDFFQLHDSSMLTIVGHDIGKSYEAISKVMEIIGRVQPGQQLQHTIHKLPIIRDRHYIQLIIPRGLENVAAEIYNALYVKA